MKKRFYGFGILIRKAINIAFSALFSKQFFLFCPASVRAQVINFYAKWCHTGTGTINHHHLVRLIFFNLIDHEIKTNKKTVEYYQGLIFKDIAGLQWSISKYPSKEFMHNYYMKDGRNSCLPEIVKYIKTQACQGKKFKLLDIGCGTGNCIDLLEDLIGPELDRVDGVDFSESAISHAKNRFRDAKHEFFAQGTIEFLKGLTAGDDFKYDIAYSHLVLQLFTEKQVQEIYNLLFAKKICRTIFISDSCLSIVENSSVYNPGGFAYVRFDHDHTALLKKAGFSFARVVSDFRDKPNLDYRGFVYWTGSF
jgi:SAM-dependent methyltransferase